MDLYYEVNGKGKPVVLLHSGGADLRDWTFVSPLLSKHYKVVAYDGRGAGKSPAPVEPANYVEDLRALLDHLKFDKTAIVGHSLGGQIATDFALTYPERVSELVLIAPSLSGFRFSQEYEEWMARIHAAAPDAEKIIEVALDSPSYRVLKDGPHWDLMVEMFRHHLKRSLEWASFQQVWSQPPAIERLEDLTARTLFIIGTEDLPDLYRIAECFHRVPRIRFIEIAGADHMVTLTHPEELYRHITGFIEE